MFGRKCVSNKMPKTRSLGLLLLYDAVLVNIATILAFLVRFSGRIPAVNFGAYLEVALWITIVRVATFYFLGLYEEEEEKDGFDIFYSVFLAVSIGSVIMVALSFYLRTLPFPRTVFVISWAFNILFISVWHSYLFHIRQKKASPKRFLIVGGSRKGEKVIEEIKHRSFPKGELVAWVKDDGEKKDELVDLRKIMREKKVSDVIIVDSDISRKKILDIVFYSEAEGLNVWIVPGLYEIVMGKVKISHLGDIPLIRLESEPLTRKDMAMKRGIDAIFSILILLLSAPLMLLISISIKIDSKGPVLYKQKRVGYKGRVYDVYKFRSMQKEAELETGPILARRNDERITRVGYFLRKLHLDEIPQFFNILKGEMSLVGPRPERPVFVEEFKRNIPGYYRKYVVKPGITGLAQLYGGYETSAENKLKYDLAYINNWSLGMDLNIFFMSTEIILRGRM